MSETTMKSHLLHALQILTEGTVQQIGVFVAGLSILDILGSVQEPQRNLELLGIRNNRDNLGDLFLGELSGTLVHVDIALLADHIGESATDTLDVKIYIF